VPGVVQTYQAIGTGASALPIVQETLRWLPTKWWSVRLSFGAPRSWVHSWVSC